MLDFEDILREIIRAHLFEICCPTTENSICEDFSRATYGQYHLYVDDMMPNLMLCIIFGVGFQEPVTIRIKMDSIEFEEK